MSVTEPDLPPTVAVILAVSVFETDFAVAVVVATLFAPVDVTLLNGATVAGSLPGTLQLTVRPWSRLPPASRTVAETVVLVFFLIVALCNVRMTLTTVPFVTVIVAVPDCSPLDALIVAVPGTPPVTSTLCPLVADRLATLASLVVHVIA